jgi:hypothetical protein
MENFQQVMSSVMGLLSDFGVYTILYKIATDLIRGLLELPWPNHSATVIRV